MVYTDIGDKGYQLSEAMDSAVFTPQTDRTAKVTRIRINKSSASDTWVVHVGPSDVGRYQVIGGSPQNLLENLDTSSAGEQDLFDFYSYMFGEDFIYPIPFGQSIEVFSEGGATADISFEYVEVAPNEVGAAQMNYPGGNRYVGPVYLSRAASVTAVGEIPLDTQVARDDIPDLFFGDIIPSNWVVRVLGMFLQGEGVNTYSGSADHQSTTKYLGAKRRNTRLWTRDDAGGIPLVGVPSAAGSANVVLGDELNPFPAFQVSNLFDWRSLMSPLILQPGDRFRTFLGIEGDVTGGADYSDAVQVFLCDIRTGS